MKQLIRDQLLEGRLHVPSYEVIAQQLSPDTALLTQHMFQALWHNYLKDKGSISLVYWYDKFNNPEHFNAVLKALADANWIVTHSIPARNWAEASLNESKLLEYVSPDELQSIRAFHKFNKYKLDVDTASCNDKVRLNGRTKRTGLVREGFRMASNVKYSYDIDALERHREAIQLNLTKSMDKIAQMYPSMKHDQASYDTISCAILDYHINYDSQFSNGQNYIDSRGRNIQGNLNKIANYVSSKDFRASLVIPD